MPGLISITQRATGDNITAAIYNSDRQEIVNGMEPATIDDASVNATQGNATLDPGETSAEVLAASLLEELEQIRFRLQEITGGSSWRTTYVTRNVAVMPSTQTDENTLWTHGSGTTVLLLRFRIPNGWNSSSNLSLKIFRRFLVSSGTAKMVWSYARIRDGTSPTSTGNGVIDITHVDGLSHLLTLTIPTSVTIAAGDTIVVSISRLGNDAGDTNLGTLVCDGYDLEYTGIGGR